MAWKKVGEVDITVTQNGAEQDSFTASDATTVELFNYIANHGSDSINGPNDNLSGSGYYSSISNNISDNGAGTINGPNDTMSGAGYYSSISNNIANRGTPNISSPGDIPTNSGYYSGFDNNISTHGSGSINGPYDNLSGSGYYSSISNNITDQGRPNINNPNDIPGYFEEGYYDGFDNNIPNHGTGYIDGPSDTLSGRGYYTGIQNNIADQGSLGNVTPGSQEDSGYYSSGTIPKPSYSTEIQVNGSTEYGPVGQSSDSTYDINVSANLSGGPTIPVSDSGNSSKTIISLDKNVQFSGTYNITQTGTAGYSSSISVDGTTIGSADGFNGDSGSFSESGSTITASIESDSSWSIDFDIIVDVSAEISVNGVSKY